MTTTTQQEELPEIGVSIASARVGDVEVDFTWDGEGLSGDYWPEDPNDVPLVRVTAIDHSGQDRHYQDSSFCTVINANVYPNDLVYLAAHLASTLEEDKTDRWDLEGWSWLNQGDVESASP